MKNKNLYYFTVFDKYNKTIIFEKITDYLLKISQKNNILINYV